MRRRVLVGSGFPHSGRFQEAVRSGIQKADAKPVVVNLIRDVVILPGWVLMISDVSLDKETTRLRRLIKKEIVVPFWC